ncbi:hypothetical protein D1871_15610 [Nakamurella silvestris]|nr:hypothetical protein D1871_15610 [Nakamurella silvestris]
MSTRTALGSEIRRVLLAKVEDREVSVDEVAKALSVNTATAEGLLRSERWDLDVALDLAQGLGITFDVVAH